MSLLKYKLDLDEKLSYSMTPGDLETLKRIEFFLALDPAPESSNENHMHPWMEIFNDVLATSFAQLLYINTETENEQA